MDALAYRQIAKTVSVRRYHLPPSTSNQLDPRTRPRMTNRIADSVHVYTHAHAHRTRTRTRTGGKREIGETVPLRRLATIRFTGGIQRTRESPSPIRPLFRITWTNKFKKTRLKNHAPRNTHNRNYSTTYHHHHHPSPTRPNQPQPPPQRRRRTTRTRSFRLRTRTPTCSPSSIRR